MNHLDIFMVLFNYLKFDPILIGLLLCNIDWGGEGFHAPQIILPLELR